MLLAFPGRPSNACGYIYIYSSLPVQSPLLSLKLDFAKIREQVAKP